MLTELTDSARELVSSLIPYEVGSEPFFTVLGVSLLVWLVVARVFMALFKSERGLVMAIFALLLPLILGLSAYVLADRQLVSMLQADWAQDYLPAVMFSVVAFCVILVLSNRCMGLNWLTTLIVFSFASTAAWVAGYGTIIALETIEKGSEQIQERNERNDSTIESIAN